MKREERTVFQVRLNDRAMKSLKVLARRKKTYVNTVLIEAINDLFEKYDRKPVATAGKVGRPPSK